MKKIFVSGLVMVTMIGSFVSINLRNNLICEAVEKEIVEKSEDIKIEKDRINEINKSQLEVENDIIKNKKVYKEGWKTKNNKKYYILANGKKAKGWQRINGKTYYFDKWTSERREGWFVENGKKYYFDQYGVLVRGWRTIENKKYYFSSMGVTTKGLNKISGKEYYFDNYGVMKTGMQTINGKIYYFLENGQRSKQQEIVLEAKKHIGKKYVYGATGPNSFDCSGLTQYVYNKNGIKLNRTTYTQVKQGRYISRNQLQPGDLIFTNGSSNAPGHVGIYSGNGKYIHAANVKEGVIESKIYNYSTARRIL